MKTLPQVPAWVTPGRPETFEAVAFRSGAALTVLYQLISDPRHGVPVKPLANRLALTAATTTSKLEGRLAGEAEIRDAYYPTPQGEARGPDGDPVAFWRDGEGFARTGRVKSLSWSRTLNDRAAKLAQSVIDKMAELLERQVA